MDRVKKNTYIYVLYLNGCPFYVGDSYQPGKRALQHLTNWTSAVYLLSRYLMSRGLLFTVRVVATTEYKTTHDVERRYIAEYGSHYNLLNSLEYKWLLDIIVPKVPKKFGDSRPFWEKIQIDFLDNVVVIEDGVDVRCWKPVLHENEIGLGCWINELNNIIREELTADNK